jgi:CheY-like chemotaxis protein
MAAIFIADDDPLLIDLLCFRLERRGHKVRSSTDGDEALQQILEYLCLFLPHNGARKMSWTLLIWV